MGVQALASGSISKHNQGSTVPLFLSIVDNTTGLGVTAQTPTVAVRMYLPGQTVDGYFFNGTIFVTGGVINLAMTEVDAVNAPGLYVYVLVDPGLPVLTNPVTKVTYNIRYHNAGTPTGDAWEIREFSRALKDFNTQGA